MEAQSHETRDFGLKLCCRPLTSGNCISIDVPIGEHLLGANSTDFMLRQLYQIDLLLSAWSHFLLLVAIPATQLHNLAAF